MAQSYFSPRAASPVKELASNDATLATLAGDKFLKVEDVQEAYIAHKDRLVGAIDDTQSILYDLRAFNKDEWVVKYPQIREGPSVDASEDSATAIPKRRKLPRRSLSFADDPCFETQVVISGPRRSLSRATTLASIPDVINEDTADVSATKDGDERRLIPTHEFNVLRLDLKLGAHTSPASAASLVTQLEKASIANLLDERICASLGHIDKLRLRVEDTSSKVLVTGDLNAGKSTFVNALLRREVMPIDQQPCTTAFCEVHDATENQGKEEMHILKNAVSYNINDESTYTRASLADLEDIVTDNEDTQRIVKLYLADARAHSESLLNNGVVDISLIDAPGLNRDSLKTTAVFARQEEIDVVVFVVSAENHFTLSAKDFLWTASNEKAYLFIVVNKFDQIRNKDKCKRLVLEQIKQLSPRTFEDARDLVHFVDSASALQPFAVNPAFDDLESSLRSFVLAKRSKSKLQPVSTYLSNLLSDVELLAGANSIFAETEIQRARDDLVESRPVLEKMKSCRDILEDSLETVEEDGGTKATNRTKDILINALERVAQGRLGVDRSPVSMPLYPGLLGIWDYAREVRRALLLSLDAAVKLAEDEARIITSSGVDRIKALGDEHLPDGVERNRRVFMPEAMFSNIRRGRAEKGRHSSVVAGGLHGLGIGLAQRSDMLETTFLDLFDVQHQLLIPFGISKVDDEDPLSPGALSLVSVGVGALTMVGGQAIGARGLLEGVVRATDLFANEATRKWMAPILGAVTVGLTAYLIMELPTSIPRTVGRRIKTSVSRSGGRSQELYIDFHARRVSTETRKVLKLASWDLRERFRAAMEDRTKEVRSAEEMEGRASKAQVWFGEISKRADQVRIRLGEDT
ncbi:hypothetical protein AMATHDRAFT_73057 [Amanita thiersii Skay4041]|uniref:Dynamin-type G domain-containing protein n=1 Tax=Amanita thiersii Skay4041 TaxID=703135 RepID=A0A2A9P0N5_9AGAR|nr:hypothetical protein AMATHDRAFT_73057 [Amanita thiersii Skay4041]